MKYKFIVLFKTVSGWIRRQKARTDTKSTLKKRNEAENKCKSATKASVKEISISRQENNSELVIRFLGVYKLKGLLPKHFWLISHIVAYTWNWNIKCTNNNNKYTFQPMHRKEQCKLTIIFIHVPPLTLQTSLFLWHTNVVYVKHTKSGRNRLFVQW